MRRFAFSPTLRLTLTMPTFAANAANRAEFYNDGLHSRYFKPLSNSSLAKSSCLKRGAIGSALYSAFADRSAGAAGKRVSAGSVNSASKRHSNGKEGVYYA
ncbi:MAG: hypothetical protein LBI57_02575 [Helicobacteraceae bacterium]|nr:hypothetical protein [Helicobacteraceae bacterium]